MKYQLTTDAGAVIPCEDVNHAAAVMAKVFSEGGEFSEVLKDGESYDFTDLMIDVATVYPSPRHAINPTYNPWIAAHPEFEPRCEGELPETSLSQLVAQLLGAAREDDE